MRLPSTTTGLIAAVFLVTVALGLGWQYYQGRQPEISDVGGTILAYRLDPQDKAADAEKVAEALQRRFAFDGMRHVKVRVGPADEVEVVIPRVGDHAADIRSVRDLVSQTGRLEFRVLANGNDDRDAIEAAQRQVNQDRDADARLAQAFVTAQLEGLPPPALQVDGQPRRFRLVLAGGQASLVSYSWIELGQPERTALHLDAAARDDPQRKAAWTAAAEQRGRAACLPEALGRDQRFLLAGAVFYSRICRNRHLTEDERRQQEVDYFVLARDPEFDPATGQRTPAIDGRFLSAVFPDRDLAGRRIIGFVLTPDGGELFARLTRSNVSGQNAVGLPRTMRHLGIILDGRLMSAPTINSEIRSRGSISGSFTDRQVLEMVSILRAGSLPGTLLPRPVRETVVAAGQGR